MVRLKVVTLNLWMGNFIDRIENFLKKEDADVYLCQEVTKGADRHLTLGYANTFERILEKTNLQGTFAPMWKIERKNYSYTLGVAIFSKHDLKNINFCYYHGQETSIFGDLDTQVNFPSVLLKSEIELEEKSVTMMTTHFPWSKYPEITIDQNIAVKQLTRLLKNENELILGGDFNVTDESSIYQLLVTELSDDRPGQLERSLHPIIHRAGEKNLAVDYMFHKSTNIKLVKSEVLELPLSDHLPLIAEYEIS